MATIDVNIFKPAIIQILGSSNEETTSKEVRKTLQTQFPMYNLEFYKAELNKLIREIFDNEDEDEQPLFDPAVLEEHDVKPRINSDDFEDAPTSSFNAGLPIPSFNAGLPSFKKKSVEEREAEQPRTYTQAEMSELVAAEARRLVSKSIRDSGARPVAQSSSGFKKSKKPADPDRAPSTTGFNKPHYLSEALQACTGGEQIRSRPQTVKELWVYIKENGLQKQGDKRFITCDAALRAVFNTHEVHMFTMQKLLSAHLSPVDGKAPASRSKKESGSSPVKKATKKGKAKSRDFIDDDSEEDDYGYDRYDNINDM